jgi:hypothetical protein
MITKLVATFCYFSELGNLLATITNSRPGHDRARFRTVLANDRNGKGFLMPAADEGCRLLRRPASENLPGRKPREMRRWRWVGLDLWGFEGRACGVEVGWRRPVRMVGKMGRRDGSGSEGAGAVEG